MLTKTLRVVFKNDLIAGCFLVLASYTPFLFQQVDYGLIGSLIVAAAFFLGILMISNFITVRLGGFSLVYRIRGSPKNNRNFILISIIIGLFFSFISADLGGLWYYPHWTTTSYYVIGFLLGGWAFYILALIAS